MRGAVLRDLATVRCADDVASLVSRNLERSGFACEDEMLYFLYCHVSYDPSFLDYLRVSGALVGKRGDEVECSPAALKYAARLSRKKLVEFVSRVAARARYRVVYEAVKAATADLVARRRFGAVAAVVRAATGQSIL